jgi:hypothetical protein
LIVVRLAYSSFGYQAAPRPFGCKVEDRPQGIDVRGSARGVGHLAAPEVADCAIAASEDIEAGDIAIVGADVREFVSYST